MTVTDSTGDVIGSLIARLPKAELHIHIEGSLEADLMIKVRSLPERVHERS